MNIEVVEASLGQGPLEHGPYPGPMSREEFRSLAEMIIELAGVQHPAWTQERRSYEDLVVRIQTSMFRARNIEVERVFNRNPVTMAADNRVYRHHGEHAFIVPHMIRLVRRLQSDANPDVLD